ncbi:RsmB/NOP family class I SAM-dependent RNA methyltransferase [Paracoccus sp. M683]|uniref:RsmB/NOP family class I SAM-dependent RNA methyltransferase n=1 Tax=Paracoccus sp. M683 TaxID=2594268 RepID=UPI00117E94F4|nr:RsmB/NOP family class I SAM-dependent RNA methyltransferase [Paracoccus sp. M683]TRW98283.1 RsmB/NOP family class I SAM-dependent RNA methyltransferase [Paracoccus sp. M683]
MTPQARVAAAIDILDQIAGGAWAEPSLLRWSRSSRFAGSGDRAAVRDLVFDALRRREAYAALGGGHGGRCLMLGRIRHDGGDPDQIFNGAGHAPAPLTKAERLAGMAPDRVQSMNLPEWVLPLWDTALGREAQPVALAMADRAPVWLRANLAKVTPDQAMVALAEDGIAVRSDPRLPSALEVVSGERRIGGSRSYRDGLVELQDLSPQLACAALPLVAGQSVLDYCAGGGGKALAVAAGFRVSVDAHDADPARMADLPARATRAGTPIRPVARPQGAYDLVITDVPCSGSGTWRRSPDAKWRLDRRSMDSLLNIQSNIMDEVVPLVRRMGYLAYMTCSVLVEENDGQAQAFLTRNPDFTQVIRRQWTPLDGSDGFFLSLFQRQG